MCDTQPLGPLAGFRRVLVFGGSFDPPHLAHVSLPEQVRQAIGADVVVYMPAGRAPHKLNKQQTDSKHRLAMLRLALADAIEAKTAVVLEDEIRRVEQDGRPSYTVDTLTELQKQIDPGAEMRLLIGTDQVRIFKTWRAWERVIELAQPVVMVRPPETKLDLPEAWRDRVVEVATSKISSTQVRQQVAVGGAMEGMLAGNVATYIRKNKLYLAE
ncbi:MAG: nicotinate (nicotinamide) nucleotide adenylyltransferase [Algisphaera sp.]